MDNFTSNQEILFITGNHFSQREFCETREQDDNTNKKSPQDKLMDACRNGLLTELLPELQVHGGNQKLSIWDVQQSNHFIGMRLGSLQPVEAYFSINPYIFTDRVAFN